MDGQAIALLSRVDDLVIDHIEAMLQHCKQHEDALGPQAVLHTVLGQRQLVGALLADCPDRLRPRLLSVHGNTELTICALCNMSYFASWHGKAHAGIDFAAAAQGLVGKIDDVLLQVCAADRAGSAYAVDGQYKECMAEFDRTQAGL